MKDTFGVDHVIYQASVDVLRKLNRLGFKIMGDMNYHNHIGIARCRCGLQFSTKSRSSSGGNTATRICADSIR